MLQSNIRERSLCLLNSENLDSNIRPWLKISETEFHPDICSLYSSANINPIQSIQTDYLPPFISYLWPLVYHGVNLWAVDHPPTRDSNTPKFVYKYDLLIWNQFSQIKTDVPRINSNTVYPKLLVLAPDWLTCETTYKHLSNVQSELLKNFSIACLYEGQNIETDLYKTFLAQGCDLLIATPTIINDLIERRYIHFEQLQLIIYDQLDLLLHQSLEKIFQHFQLHSNAKLHSIQHVFLSRVVNPASKDFLQNQSFPTNLVFLSSSFMETCTYRNFFIYAEPCRNWMERKCIIKQTLDLAYQSNKKVLMCAYQTRRLATMQSILNDLSIQSILIHSQLSNEEIQQFIHEWQTINDRPFILLIQDEILNEVSIANTDILIHLDVQRLFWYKLYNQRMKLIHKHLMNTNENFNSVEKLELTSLKSIEKFYQKNPSSNIPLIVILWPGDCAQVTHELIVYIKNSSSYLHPLIERLAKNNCHESLQAKINVELCPTLKMFGECLQQKKLKRCPYRHHFHPEVDYIEDRMDDHQPTDTMLSNSYELFLPHSGEVELCVTHVSDGNRLWANILRWRTETNQTLTKIFDYEEFDRQVCEGFNHVKHRPLREIVLGEVYFYADENQKIHRVYVHEHEQTYFDIRRADAILNRLLKVSNTAVTEENQRESTISEENKPSSTMANRPLLTVFSLDTGRTFTLKSHENLFPIEPSTLKQYPPLATEIILCNIHPLDQITMTFTPFTIETLRLLTLNEVFMGKIKLATRSCFWIDPLVKPVRLAALKRIAYDKPIRKQLILSKLVQANDDHMHALERSAIEAGILHSPPVQHQEETPTKPIAKDEEEGKPMEDLSPGFKPFVNRLGQLIINPVGRSKEFFSKHNQDFAKPISSESHPEQATRYVPLGRGHRLKTDLLRSEPPNPQPPTVPVTDAHQVKESSPFQQIEIEQAKEEEKENEEDVFEDTIDTLPNAAPVVPQTDSKEEAVHYEDDDQMMFIFGPKLFSQLRQIKDMEDEQRRQADFPVQRNRNRHMRNHLQPKGNNSQETNTNHEGSNENAEQQTLPPNMSRYEPFVGERGPLTQEQIDYKQSQRKTRLFWEQTSRDVYLTIGFYNVESTQTRVDFDVKEIYCRTKIRTYDRYVRLHLAHEILPEKSSFQVRRSNILLTLRKSEEGCMWTALSDRAIEPRPDFFVVEYGSDDESDTDKRRRTVNRQWEQIREDKRKANANRPGNEDEKYLLDDMEEDEHLPPTQDLNKLTEENKNEDELTDTSSDCHSTDSDDCYYEDQVPANHIPRGYDEADYDHRFYGSHIRS